MEVRFTTYNIQFGLGQDGKYDLDRVVDAVGDADIVCLQEVTTYWEKCRGDHQPDRLSAELDMYSVFSSGFELGSSSWGTDGRVDNKRRAFGNMVLSRWPIVYSRSHSLERPPAEVPPDFPDPKTDLPRCALEGIIDIPGFPVRVLSIHLSHLPGGPRAAQVSTLCSLLVSLPVEAPLWERSDLMIEPWTQKNDAPPVVGQTILAGDFNFKPGDPEYAAMLLPSDKSQLVDGWLAAKTGHRAHAPTCVENDGSTTTLDYAFFTAGLSDSIVDARVRNDIKASDHFPLVFDLNLRLTHKL